MRLGRVTCLTRDLQVFVDDYILCEDPVADYLTRFSGLKQEDLEIHHSKHYPSEGGLFAFTILGGSWMHLCRTWMYGLMDG